MVLEMSSTGGVWSTSDVFCELFFRTHSRSETAHWVEMATELHRESKDLVCVNNVSEGKTECSKYLFVVEHESLIPGLSVVKKRNT